MRNTFLPSTEIKQEHNLLVRGERSSNRAQRALTSKYNKMPQNPKAGERHTQNWILLNVPQEKVVFQQFF